MYNLKYTCSYKRIDCEDQMNNAYRDDLLNVLGLEIFDETQAANIIKDVMTKVKDYKPLKDILLKSAQRYFSEDLEFGLLLLFSYDTLDAIHECVKEYYEKNEISSAQLKLLNAAI